MGWRPSINMAELLGLAAGQGGEAPFSSTPLLWFVLKNLPWTGVNETTGKVGKATRPQLHSSPVSQMFPVFPTKHSLL